MAGFFNRKPKAKADGDGSRTGADLSLLRQKQTDRWIAAIDFGTTYSKAAMVRVKEGRVAQDDVVLLSLAEDGGYLLPSALFIHNDRIVFGRRAFELSADVADPGRLRFESPKRLVSKLNRDELRRLAPAAIDPSGRFTNGELLTLLLGYLACRFDLALKGQEQHLQGLLPLLRISRPAWSLENEEDGEKLLAEHLGRAFVLARTLEDGFADADGLATDRARAALDAVDGAGDDLGAELRRLLMRKPGGEDCIDRGFVPESTAVAAAYIEPRRGQGMVMVVSDVGGGTSDFGVFLSAPGAAERGRIGEIVRGRVCLERGGDDLDAIVYAYLRGVNELVEGLPAHQARLARLKRGIRTYKETLFRDGELLGEIEGDLKDLLQQPALKAFALEIQRAFSTPNRIALDYWGPNRELRIIRTGGGATLPFVVSLGGGPDGPAPPDWMTDPNYQIHYPQMAVAIGAAMPVMPEQR
jgi:molecular chaperone HscA